MVRGKKSDMTHNLPLTKRGQIKMEETYTGKEAESDVEQTVSFPYSSTSMPHVSVTQN